MIELVVLLFVAVLYAIGVTIEYRGVVNRAEILDAMNAALWKSIKCKNDQLAELRELRDGPYNRLLARMTAEGKQAGKEGAE